MPADEPAVRLLGIRALEGPNLYFPRPAIRVTADLTGWYAAPEMLFSRVIADLGGRTLRPGAPRSVQRARTVLRLTARLTRRLAAESGTPRLGVRVREASSPYEVVIAYPWNRRERAKELGRALVQLLTELLTTTSGADVERAVARAAQRVQEVPSEAHYRMATARVPTIAITGTNGKTTTTRLVAHIAQTAGLKTAWSSTEGVLVNGQQVLQGDYSGPGGAREVLATDGLDIAVLETARGGLLNKGMAVAATDVSVVTNVSPDHLGTGGIDTLDQLAEVKGIVTKVVKPDGWAVLNGDDPRVWAMRTSASARPMCFTLDPHSPAIRQALELNGQVVTVRDKTVVLISASGITDIVRLDEVPMTLAGLSTHNVANALAGAAGALALGLPRDAVTRGLQTFAPDAQHNPGRMNVYSLPWAGGHITVIIDMAHNEAGLDALLNVARGLVPPGKNLILGLGTGGDRTDDILANMGEQAGLGADRIHIVHKESYLRGRSMADLESHLRAGLARVGAYPVASWEDELVGFPGTLHEAQAGDVVAFMTHTHQRQLHEWLLEHHATMDDAGTIAAKARAHRDADAHADVAAQRLRVRVEHAIASLRAARDEQTELPADVQTALTALEAWQTRHHPTA